jgi:hypothetical protein
VLGIVRDWYIVLADKVLDALAHKYPHAYFSGMVALSKIVRWEVSEESALDRADGSYV